MQEQMSSPMPWLVSTWPGELAARNRPPQNLSQETGAAIFLNTWLVISDYISGYSGACDTGIARGGGEHENANRL
jgi:hypothetical protein